MIINSKKFKIADDGKTNNELSVLSKNLLQFYADCFHKGNKAAAKKALDSQHNEIRKEDSNVISFFVGGSLVLLMVLIYLLIIPPADG